MKYISYSKATWDKIQQSLDRVLKQDPHPVAAFDADGTLWDTDLGENFFHYKINRKLVELPPEPWQHYNELKKKNNDPREAYLWLGQICAGQKIETVKGWAEKAFKEIQPNPIFEEQRKLIQLFKQKGVQVFIVTASIKWAVEPGAVALGLSPENVIGIETLVENNTVTKAQKGVITYREGKVQALLQHTNQKKAFFASGNTEGDLALLESATDLRLVVSAASRDQELFRTENKMQQLAAERNWLYHRFV